MIDLLFPKNINCIFCSLPIHEENYLSLCKKCYQKLKFLEEICIRCGRSGKGRTLCTDCASEKYYFDRAFSVLEYNDTMHHQIYAYKYGQKSFLGKYFGQLMQDFLIQNKIEYDFIVPVPISTKRENTRGYNQSLLFALAIDEEKTLELFIRKKHTKFLSGLSAANRILELQDAFAIDEEALSTMLERYYQKSSLDRDAESVAKEREDESDDPLQFDPKIQILMVDDILTTGSTLNELSKLLKENVHNVEITVLTLCNARK